MILRNYKQKRAVYMHPIDSPSGFIVQIIYLHPPAQFHGFHYFGDRNHIGRIAHIDSFAFGHINHIVESRRYGRVQA